MIRHKGRRAAFLSLLALVLAGCAMSVNSQSVAFPRAGDRAGAQAVERLNHLADRYIALTLEAGTHEAEYVDAYYGPEALREAARANPRTIPVLIAEARALIADLDGSVIPALADPDELRRARSLRGMLVAAETRMQIIGGRSFSFEDEAAGLFSVRPRPLPLTHYDTVLDQLDRLVPGRGSLAGRVDAFNERFTIPADRLHPVFDAAIAECRRRTARHIELPEGESFTMEFVTGKPWSGYNYYLGNYRSLIQINTDLPIRISRAVDLGCHEGYPGHHVLNLLVEDRMARGRGWREYQVNPLYSPTSVLAEGSANYGIDLAFPALERLTFERDILYPLAGLEPALAESYWRVQQATEALGGARLTIAKMYLDGEIDRARAVALTQRYLLLSPARAEQSVAFTDHYRSYVLNYGWGRDLVRAYIEYDNADTVTRWARMERILSEPTTPADLIGRY